MTKNYITSFGCLAVNELAMRNRSSRRVADKPTKRQTTTMMANHHTTSVGLAAGYYTNTSHWKYGILRGYPAL